MSGHDTELTGVLLAEILRDAHRYAPGIAQGRPTLVRRSGSPARVALSDARDRSRDLVERVACRVGFSRQHFDADTAAQALQRVLALSAGFAATYDALADEHSRRRMVELLKLRVLGPYHVALPTTPERYRAEQARVEAELTVQPGTFEVSDPWFSPLSLYRIGADGEDVITLHDHSVDIVSVFLLDQYTYAYDGATVGVEPGDVVLDIGGCWGETALYFARRVGPSGKVYTFEFDPESLNIMRTNLGLNPHLAPRIEIVERALWDRSGDTITALQAGRCTTVQGPEAAQGDLQVATITLDDFVREAGLDRVSFVKMDVEGAEPRALSGARQTLATLAPKLAIAAYHRDDDLVRLPEAILSAQPGYRLYLDTASPVEDETVLFAAATR